MQLLSPDFDGSIPTPPAVLFVLVWGTRVILLSFIPVICTEYQYSNFL